MKIAIIGSAPSSIRLAPYADPTWKIWGCSPGAFPVVGRSDVWFELHRWEPPVIGRADQQRPWFSPEYCLWLANHPKVIMFVPVPQVPNSCALDVDGLTHRYGHYNFTSSIAWMLAMAIEEIQASRESRKASDEEVDVIGLWGVDMAATEEYGYQRAGCQFFIQIAGALGIQIHLPPESDLMVPPVMYGVCEHEHMHIKMLERKRELEGRLNQWQNTLQNAQNQVMFLKGALDDVDYTMNTWIHRSDAKGTNFPALFEPMLRARIASETLSITAGPPAVVDPVALGVK